jgi:hypothetical protein
VKPFDKTIDWLKPYRLMKSEKPAIKRKERQYLLVMADYFLSTVTIL